VISYLPRGIYAGVPAWLIVTAVVAAPFDEHQGRLKRFLIAGGEASYAIYVIHPFGIRAGALIWERLAMPAQPWLYVALLMVVVIACAFAVNLLVERPLDRWLRTLLEPSAEARPAAAGSQA
jgi:peptidoglycan/LPS O-acetylase OafA/YrhL